MRKEMVSIVRFTAGLMGLAAILASIGYTVTMPRRGSHPRLLPRYHRVSTAVGGLSR